MDCDVHHFFSPSLHMQYHFALSTFSSKARYGICPPISHVLPPVLFACLESLAQHTFWNIYTSLTAQPQMWSFLHMLLVRLGFSKVFWHCCIFSTWVIEPSLISRAEQFWIPTEQTSTANNYFWGSKSVFPASCVVKRCTLKGASNNLGERTPTLWESSEITTDRKVD